MWRQIAARKATSEAKAQRIVPLRQQAECSLLDMPKINNILCVLFLAGLRLWARIADKAVDFEQPNRGETYSPSFQRM